MSEEMKIAELMKPRIMCVEPFLGMKREGWELNLISTIEVGEDYQFLMSLPVKYPLNFKLLPWWSHRTLEEMPGYVKDENGVYKVKEWHFELAPKVTVFIDAKIHQQYRKECTECPLYSDFLPATLHDYEQYTNHKTV